MYPKTEEGNAIWNINSFAEYYLQIAEKYEEDFREAMDRFCEERKWFLQELDGIRKLRVFPGQGNFVLVQLRTGSAKGLTAKLLEHHSILVKDLSDKIPTDKGDYLRVAVRSREENERLIKALKEE